MLPIHEIDLLLKQTPLHLQEIVLELRNLIFSAAVDAVEVVRWGGLSYFHAGGGGIVSAGICQIGLHEDHIRLAFIHGAFLADPKGLLRGDMKAKRYVRINSYEDTPWEDLENLLRASAAFDPRTLNL